MPPPLVEGGPPSLPTNLSALSSDQLVSALGSFSGFPPSQIQDSLQLLGTAALGAEGNFSFSTNDFTLGIQSLGAEPATLLSPGLEIAMPPLANLFPGAAAAAVIQWTTNPYANLTVAVPDAPVISLSVLDSTGAKISVKNLSKPISMNWDLKISPDDPRIQPPPAYVADCAHGILYIDDGMSFLKFHGAVVLGNSSWKVPCLLGIHANFKCVGSGFQNFVCPSIAYEHDCMYWDSVLSNWSNDGCVAVSGSLTGVVCECTHLTDFSARLRAVAESNKAIFDNAASVYSLDGLERYKQWYAIFGGIALLTLILGFIVVYVDVVAAGMYVKVLLKNPVLRQLLAHQPKDPIYVYDEKSTLDASHALLEETHEVVRLNVLNRVLQQHSRLQFLFRYDPRLSRLFRLLFLFVVQFHSLFVSALFYSFTYGTKQEPMQWYDTVILAMITTGLNIPVVQVLVHMMNKIGNREFQFMYPLLFNEYTRRSEYEEFALIYLAKKNETALPTLRSRGGFCSCRKVDEVDSPLHMEKRRLLREMAAVVKEQYPYVERYPAWKKLLPAHTALGWFYLAGCFGWFGWCLNYLLLFAAAHEKSVGEHIMISYAESELSNIFLIQPFTIVATILMYRVLQKCSNRLPKWLKNMLLVSSVDSIPSLYYFSDPWNYMSNTSFTAEFAYNIFIKAAATASGVDELAYAPMSAIAAHVGGLDGVEEGKEADSVADLYRQMWKEWLAIQSH